MTLRRNPLPAMLLLLMFLVGSIMLSVNGEWKLCGSFLHQSPLEFAEKSRAWLPSGVPSRCPNTHALFLHRPSCYGWSGNLPAKLCDQRLG